MNYGKCHIYNVYAYILLFTALQPNNSPLSAVPLRRARLKSMDQVRSPAHWPTVTHDADDLWPCNDTGRNNGTSSRPFPGNSPEDEYACSLYDFLIESVCMGTLCAFGFVGNTLSTVCLWKDKWKTATPFLLISLEMADTSFLITVLLLRVVTSIETFTSHLPPVTVITPYLGKYVYPCAMIAETGEILISYTERIFSRKAWRHLPIVPPDVVGLDLPIV